MDDRYRGVVKEADEVRLLPFPEGGHWRSWRANTIHAVVSAAGRQDDVGQEWIMRVESDDPWALENPGDGWVSLDRKLAAALTKIAATHGKELGREITQHDTAALSNNRVIRGRVLLAIVFRYYTSGANGQVMYAMNHLQTLVLHGDN